MQPRRLGRIGMGVFPWGALAALASECDECGACGQRCPFGVDAPARMRQAAAMFEKQN